jgi:hypothetical protein
MKYEVMFRMNEVDEGKINSIANKLEQAVRNSYVVRADVDKGVPIVSLLIFF